MKELLHTTNQAFIRAKAVFDKETDALAGLCANAGVEITNLEAFSLLVVKAKMENRDYKNHLITAIALAGRLEEEGIKINLKKLSAPKAVEWILACKMS
jgi:hypothetical protein